MMESEGSQPYSPAQPSASRWDTRCFPLHLAAIYVIVNFCTSYLAGLTRLSLLPLLQIPTSASSFEFLFSHLLVFSFVPAFALGLLNSRFNHKAAQFVWVIPASVLAYKLMTFPVPSVLQNPVSTAFYHYFNSEFLISEFRDWQTFRDLVSNPDVLRGADQFRFTAPFYAGVGYSIATWIGRRTDVSGKLSEEVKKWEECKFQSREQ